MTKKQADAYRLHSGVAEPTLPTKFEDAYDDLAALDVA